MFKKSTLAALIAASIVPAAAMADSVVYGQAKVFYGQETINTTVPPSTTAKDESAFRMQSSGSRVGFKGSTELSGGLKAIYKFEYGVNPVEGRGINSNRNNIVGLSGAFGTVAMGTHDTPLKMVQGKVDVFNDYYRADMRRALGNNYHGELRPNNVFYYGSPKIADNLQFHVALIPGERHGVKDRDGIADIASVAAIYKADQFYFGIGHDTRKDLNHTRLAAQFKADMFGVGALYQMANDERGANKIENQGFVVSGYLNATDAVKVKLQYAGNKQETISVPNSETDRGQISAGVDYKFGKYTTGTFFLTKGKDKQNGQADDSGNYQFVGVGLMHKF